MSQEGISITTSKELVAVEVVLLALAAPNHQIVHQMLIVKKQIVFILNRLERHHAS